MLGGRCPTAPPPSPVLASMAISNVISSLLACGPIVYGLRGRTMQFDTQVWSSYTAQGARWAKWKLWWLWKTLFLRYSQVLCGEVCDMTIFTTDLAIMIMTKKGTTTDLGHNDEEGHEVCEQAEKRWFTMPHLPYYGPRGPVVWGTTHLTSSLPRWHWSSAPASLCCAAQLKATTSLFNDWIIGVKWGLVRIARGVWTPLGMAFCQCSIAIRR